MTCRKARKLVPLAAGGDLRPRPAAAFRAHIDACPECRRELEAFRKALGTIREEAKAAGVAAWGEDEWSALVSRVRAGAAGERSRGADRAGTAFRRCWAAASALGVLAASAILYMMFMAGPVPGRKTAPAGPGTVAGRAEPQEVLTMTMVSPETGLQIVWFFDRNFDYKGEQE
ncbi:MAG TPA: zf-HC2 domain-containing protein [Candidatus Aminicenantes bacterium]|nr:zf-HC2 domain-containing protein [Candidatus Aminicenantes bacterium]HRY63731.1 zf-HC2 domain-containing protein [Candidatus Aminicenantes bacterium]HRZ70644.1 zf-HC2 domain-containing protein [Candidatus Aminicenantes bacterium]